MLKDKSKPQVINEHEKNVYEQWLDKFQRSQINFFGRIHSLKTMIYAELALIFVLVICMFFLIQKPKVIPYVIEISDSGRVVNYGKLMSYNDYTIDPVTVKHFVTDFINNIRQVDNDSIVIKRKWNKAFDFATDKCAAILNKMYEERRPVELMDNYLVDLKIVSYLEKTRDARELEWIETYYTKTGAVAFRKRYRGLLTYKCSSNLISDKNPAGLFIDSLVIGEVAQ